MTWRTIECYPVDAHEWGPEVLVLTHPLKTHVIIHGVPQPEFTVPPVRHVAHLEAGMWLVRLGGSTAWSEMDTAPAFWAPIDDDFPVVP